MKRDERFEALVAAAGPSVLGYLARRTASADDAADVYQQVLMVAWQKLPVVPRDHDAALPWLLVVARNQLANHRRAAVRRSQATERLASQLRVATKPAQVDLAPLLAALSPDDAELVTLIHWDGLSVKAASAVLGLSAATARKRLERARRQLRSVLRETPEHRDSDLRAV